VLDVADFEQVAAPIKQPKKSLSVRLFGADPTGGTTRRRRSTGP